MTNNPAGVETNFAEWATVTGSSAQDIAAAWQDLVRRGLAEESAGQITVTPLALRRAISGLQRRLVAHLSDYLLTENSFIIRRAGNPPGLPHILNTRIAVEQIASYFKDGWGVMEIQRDLPILTREEIEAAIQYYLNHRAEIEQDLRQSRELYETNAPKPETMSI